MTPLLDLDTYHGTTVLRDVDHSRACQFWLIPMSDAELEQWWAEHITFDSNPNGVFDALYLACGETPPPHRTLALPGTFLDADPDAWVALADSRQHYSCSLCCDSDSYLRRPDGSFLYHAGYTGTRHA